MTTIPFPIDDYASNINTHGVIAIGKPVRATFDYGYYYSYADSDWFKVQLNAGETYVFAMSNIAMPTFNHTALALRDAAGQELTVRLGNGANGATFEYTAIVSGTYFVDARTMSAYSMSSQNIYQVSLELKPAGDDYAASTSTSGTGVLGVQKSAVHETAGDSDWFAYTFQAGKTYSLAPAAGNAGLVDLSVINGSGVVVAAPGTAFTPTESGKYYVAATAYKAANYAFTVAEAVDDHGSDATTTSKLAHGGTVNARLDFIGDKDWFKVSLAANTFYTFELDMTQPGAGEAIKLLLMKPDGSPVTDVVRTTNAEGKAIMMVRVDTAGDYFANVSYGTYVGGETAEQYTLKWSATAVLDDAGDTDLAAKSGTVDTPMPGELTGSQDKDVYKFTLSKGVTYMFNVSGADGSRVTAELRDSDGGYWGASYVGSTFGFTPDRDGVYTMSLTPRGDEFQRLQYTLNATKPADDYAAHPAGAGSLAVGATIKGSMLEGGGDRDWIGVEMTAGKTYWLTLSNDGTSNGYGTGWGKIVDATGAVFASVSPYMSYQGFNLPTLAITPTVSGTYYYEVSSQMPLWGNYKLSAAFGTPDDAGNRVMDAVELANNVARTGVLEVSTDVDFYRVKPAAGSPYAITLDRGDNTSAYNFETRFYNSASQDVYPTGYVVNGTTRTFIFEAGTDVSYASIAGTAAQNGATYKIKGFNFNDDFAGSTQTAGVVAVNGSTSGALEVAGDRDFLKVHLQAGIKYVVDLYGAAGGGGTLDATDFSLLALVDTSGYGVTNGVWKAGSEARVEVVPSVTGDYFIGVGSLSSTSSATGTYRVAVTQLSGDVTAPSLTLGVPASASTTSNIQLGFNEQMQIDASAFSIKDSAGQHVLNHSQLAVSVMHNVVTIDPSQFLQPGRTYTLEINAGGLRDLVGNLYTGQNSWTFTTPAPSAGPTSGNDMLVSTGKGSFVDGGAGIDTLVMPGARSDYQIFKLDDGRIQLQPPNGAASEVLSNVERVFFSDQAIALDVSGNGGQAYRLYKAAFDRMPDSIGVGFWTGQLDKGMSAKAIADAFLASSEFIGRYGSLTTNAEFVNLLYQNVLHRAGDAEGVAYWTNLLNQGYSRAETLLGFSDSPENAAFVASLIGTGFNYTPI